MSLLPRPACGERAGVRGSAHRPALPPSPVTRRALIARGSLASAVRVRRPSAALALVSSALGQSSTDVPSRPRTGSARHDGDPLRRHRAPRDMRGGGRDEQDLTKLFKGRERPQVVPLRIGPLQ